MLLRHQSWLEDGNPQLWDYLRSTLIVRSGDGSAYLPEFKGLPKIHKTPWRMRPIVPGHSLIMSPSAKFVSKSLKPIIAQRPYVLESSRKLARDLSELRLLGTGRRTWICTGDVVSFYPNVPLADATLTALQYVRESDHLENNEFELFVDLVELVNRNMVFTFQGEAYQQLDGLVMGLACSPDLANLYAARLEEQIVPHLNAVLFYRRYIDDCFAIVEADSYEEAREICASIQLANLEITWEVSEHAQVFLDMVLYRDQYTEYGRIEFAPYRKHLSHHERIPWDLESPAGCQAGHFQKRDQSVSGNIVKVVDVHERLSRTVRHIPRPRIPGSDC